MTPEQLAQGVLINDRISKLRELVNSESVHIGTIVEGDMHESDSFNNAVVENLTTDMKGVTETDVWKNRVLSGIQTELRLKFKSDIEAEIVKLLEELKAL